MPTINSNLLASLEATARRAEQVTAEMNDPAVASDRNRAVAAAKELSKLNRMALPYRKYQLLLRQLEESRALAADAADADMRALAGEEVKELSAQAETLIAELQDRLIMSDSAGIDSVLLEIRAGTGGEEAALFAGDLLDMYQRFAARRGWKVEVLDASPTDLGGYREIVLNVKGDNCYQFLAYEGGGHRVQRVPQTETQGRIHTSAATVAVLPEPENIEVEINWDKDVLEHVSRAGGPGGQNVNKVASAIKLEHVPTGITVSMRDEKSQHKNRAKARRILASRVYEHFRSAQVAAEAATRKSMIGSGDRSQRIRTYNYPQNRCTDHRLKGGEEGANYNLQAILAGELDELVNALISQDRALRLAAL